MAPNAFCGERFLSCAETSRACGVTGVVVTLNLFQGPVFRLRRGSSLDAETSSA
jgi:hypothetical protein